MRSLDGLCDCVALSITDAVVSEVISLGAHHTVWWWTRVGVVPAITSRSSDNMSIFSGSSIICPVLTCVCCIINMDPCASGGTTIASNRRGRLSLFFVPFADNGRGSWSPWHVPVHR